MNIDVDLDSPTPPYEQVRAQLSILIGSGRLPEGHRLPSIRQLANDLGLAPGTIGRVYRELESQGLVASRVRTGTVVLPHRSARAQVTRAQLDDAALGYAAAAHRLGADLDAAVARLRAQWPVMPQS